MVDRTYAVRIGTLLSAQVITIELDDPSVFAPTFLARCFLAEMATMPFAGLKVLDIGCGSGVLSLAAGLGGAEVTAIDINEAALDCTRHNAERFGLGVETRLSNGLDAIGLDETFDVILANVPGAAPSMTTRQNAPVDHGGTDDPLLVDVIKRGPTMMRPAGVMLTWCNDLLGLEPMENLMRDHWDTIEIRQDLATLIDEETGLRVWGYDREQLLAEGRMTSRNGRDYVGLRVYRLACWR
ncbi:MAG: 50S ribosomal protein L11 methyltransferase [Pseudomonadota bacterium]